MQLATANPAAGHPEITISGRFDAFETEAFRATVDELLAGASSDLTIDLSDVVFVDSSGLAELVRTMKHCREQDGELYLRNPSDPVRVILELTQLDLAFAVVDVEG